jgi:hypothetical protein
VRRTSLRLVTTAHCVSWGRVHAGAFRRQLRPLPADKTLRPRLPRRQLHGLSPPSDSVSSKQNRLKLPSTALRAVPRQPRQLRGLPHLFRPARPLGEVLGRSRSTPPAREYVLVRDDILPGPPCLRSAGPSSRRISITTRSEPFFAPINLKYDGAARRGHLHPDQSSSKGTS